MKKKVVTLLLAMMMSFSMVACGETETKEEPKQEAETEAEEPKQEKEEPTNLTGIWQSPNNEGSYQEAVVTEDTIEIYWISEEDNTRYIYWSGTYTAPTEAVDEYKWTSERDKEKTDSAILASTDDTKDFTYKKGKISYEVSMAGETATLELAQTSTDVPENAVAETKVDCINLDNSEGTLKYTNHELSEDYEGNPVIIAYFDYTNKKDETSYSQMTFYPQAFQNGVECDMGILMDENEAYENATKEIQKDTTLNVAFVFSIKDTSPVTLKVTDQSEENLFNNIYQEQELTLQ